MRIPLEPTCPSSPSPASSAAEPTRPSEAASAFRELLREGLERFASNEAAVARGVAEALSPRPRSQLELLALQASVYRYSQDLELASRLVDRATSAVRQTLQAQT